MNIRPLKISIITISFKSEITITKTIDSVLSQTYSNIEYIIVDGASTDKTLEIIRSYEKKFLEKKIVYKWISEQDEGISDAFNKGIKLATGELIGIVNSDDWLEPDALETIVHNLDNKHSIYCGKLRMYDKYFTLLNTRKSRPYLLSLGMYINHPTVFVKSDVYLKNKFDIDLGIAMDYDFILKSRKAGFKIKNIDKVISNMQLGGISCNIEKMRPEEKLVMKRNLPLYLYLIARSKLHFEEFILKIWRKVR